MAKPRVDWEPHSELQKDIKEFCESVGFLVGEMTYHESLPKEVIDRLRRVYTLQSLIVRTRSDIVAVHKEIQLAIDLEPKTHMSRDKHDITIEALPLIMHIREGGQCLYCYRDPFDRLSDAGWWTNNMPMPRVLLMPKRYVDMGKPVVEWFDDSSQELFSDTPVVLMDRNFPDGSNDPFYIIDEEDKKKMSDWKSLISAKMKNTDWRNKCSAGL